MRNSSRDVYLSDWEGFYKARPKFEFENTEFIRTKNKVALFLHEHAFL